MPALYGGNQARHEKTTDRVAWKQKARQKRGKIEAAWPDVMSETKMTPEMLKKQGLERPKKRAFMPVL